VTAAPDEAGLLSVETPESVAFAYELAGVGSRGLAFALDALVLGGIMLAEVVVVVLGLVVVGSMLKRDLLSFGAWVIGALLVALFVTYWGYFIFGEVARNGRTIGKRTLGIRVVRDDGGRVGVLDSVIRNLLRLVDILPGTYAIGIVSILLSKKHKRLGDMAAGTVVVRDTGDLTLLSDGGDEARRTALAREFLERRPRLTLDARYQVAVAVLATFGEQPGDWDEPTIAGRLADLTGWRARVMPDGEGRPATERASGDGSPPEGFFAQD
jgi:uncharacterized RDD family membrane protein YckC